MEVLVCLIFYDDLMNISWQAHIHTLFVKPQKDPFELNKYCQKDNFVDCIQTKTTDCRSEK